MKDLKILDEIKIAEYNEDKVNIMVHHFMLDGKLATTDDELQRLKEEYETKDEMEENLSHIMVVLEKPRYDGVTCKDLTDENNPNAHKIPRIEMSFTEYYMFRLFMDGQYENESEMTESEIFIKGEKDKYTEKLTKAIQRFIDTDFEPVIEKYNTKVKENTFNLKKREYIIFKQMKPNEFQDLYLVQDEGTVQLNTMFDLLPHMISDGLISYTETAKSSATLTNLKLRAFNKTLLDEGLIPKEYFDYKEAFIDEGAFGSPYVTRLKNGLISLIAFVDTKFQCAVHTKSKDGYNDPELLSINDDALMSKFGITIYTFNEIDLLLDTIEFYIENIDNKDIYDLLPNPTLNLQLSWADKE